MLCLIGNRCVQNRKADDDRVQTGSAEADRGGGGEGSDQGSHQGQGKLVFVRLTSLHSNLLLVSYLFYNFSVDINKVCNIMCDSLF